MNKPNNWAGKTSVSFTQTLTTVMRREFPVAKNKPIDETFTNSIYQAVSEKTNNLIAADTMSAVFNYKSNVDKSKDRVQGDIDSVVVSSTNANVWCPSCDELRKDCAELRKDIAELKEKNRNDELLMAAAELITPVYEKVLDAAVAQGLPDYITLGVLLNPKREYKDIYLSNALQALAPITMPEFERLREYKRERNEVFHPKLTFAERIELLQSSQSNEYVDLLALVDKYPALFVDSSEGTEKDDK